MTGRLLTIIIILLSIPLVANTQTLQEALTVTYQSNPTLAGQQDLLQANDEQIAIALAGWRPTINVMANTSLVSSTASLDGMSGSNNTNIKSIGLQLTQPLYDGGKTPAAIMTANANINASEANLISVEQQVFQAVITSYVNILNNKAILTLNEQNVILNEHNLKANEDRLQVGELTITDIAQTRANLMRAKAQRADVAADLITSEQSFLQITGQQAEELSPLPAMDELIPATLETALALSATDNPDLQTARHVEKATQNQINVAKSATRPQLSLVGNTGYQINSNPGANDYDNSGQSAIGFQLSVPLYQAGVEYAQIRSTIAQNHQAIANIATTSQALRQNIVSLWHKLQSAKIIVTATEMQVSANRLALEGVEIDASVGRRTTLDVLNAQQELLNSKVTLIKTKSDVYLAGTALIQATGHLTAVDLHLPVKQYDPRKYYNQARTNLFGGNYK